MIRRSKKEWIVIIFVIGFSVILSSSIFSERNKAKRAEVLKWELQTLRSAVLIYHLQHKSFPSSLGSLSAKDDLIPFQEGLAYVIENIPVDDDGMFIDPFGRPYYYDSSSGWVKSSSSGYENR